MGSCWNLKTWAELLEKMSTRRNLDQKNRQYLQSRVWNDHQWHMGITYLNFLSFLILSPLKFLFFLSKLCNLYHFRLYWSIVTMCSFSLLKKAHMAETFNFLETTCYDEANKPTNILYVAMSLYDIIAICHDKLKNSPVKFKRRGWSKGKSPFGSQEHFTFGGTES